MKALIVPAILESTEAGLSEKLNSITSLKGVERIQIDFTDTGFIGHNSLSIESFPALDKSFVWEAHLMLLAPQSFQAYKERGFEVIIIHYEAYQSEQAMEDALSVIMKLGMKPAIAISPETPVSVLRYFGDTVEQFVLLGVKPGSQGQPIQENVFDRLRELKEILPDAILELDGGVKPRFVAEAEAAGANLLVVGSALFETKDIQSNFDILASSLKE